MKKSELREYLESILIAVLLALFVRTFFLQAFRIPTGSMRTTLLEGDRILVDKVTYGIPVPFTSWRFPRVRPPRRGNARNTLREGRGSSWVPDRNTLSFFGPTQAGRRRLCCPCSSPPQSKGPRRQTVARRGGAAPPTSPTFFAQLSPSHLQKTHRRSASKLQRYSAPT